MPRSSGRPRRPAREILTTDHDFEIYRTRTQERLELVLQL